MADHALTIIAGVLPDRKDRLLFALQHLQDEHFRADIVRTIFNLLERYYDVTGGILPQESLRNLLERLGIDVSRSLLYEEVYARASDTAVAGHEFRYAVSALKDQRAEQLTGEAITTAFEVLDRGVEIERRDWKGHQDAREFLYTELSKIDRLGDGQASPEGDVRAEAAEILEDYAMRKSGGTRGASVKTGLATLDKVTSGLQNGELTLICAYTGVGKSLLCTQLAWEASVMQGKNVFFATTETVRAQVRRRLIARHSRHPRFVGEEIDSAKLKDGSLSLDGVESLQAAVEDLTTNPDYGKIYIAQVPRGATLGFIEARMARQQALWGIDLVIIDYLALLRSDRRRERLQEEYNDILKDAKVTATSFAQGRGVPIVSPWAMSQSAWREAVKQKEYTLGNLAETSEAEKSADIILSLLRLEARGELRCQILKNRDGDVPGPFTVQVDYRNGYFAEKDRARSMGSLLPGAEQGEDVFAG